MQRLDHYLMGGPPTQLIAGDMSSSSTKSKDYSPEDIKNVQIWHEFNYNTIQSQFGQLLRGVSIEPRPFTTSPPPLVTSENQFRWNMSDHFSTPLRRALRAGLSANRQMEQAVTFHTGDAAKIEGKVPDFIFGNMTLSEVRVPGDAKPSSAFNSRWKDYTPDTVLEVKFRQVLSQVNFYMENAKTCYGFIITDRELIAIQRTAQPGHLKISNPIPYEAKGTAERPQLTVLMALWYLGMLAAGNDWRLE